MKATQQKSSKLQTILSIPGSSATYVLKSLYQNGIENKFMGLDQAGRILMQIEYRQDQQKLISYLNQVMEENEKMVAEISMIFERAMNDERDRIDKVIREFREKRNRLKRFTEE